MRHGTLEWTQVGSTTITVGKERISISEGEIHLYSEAGRETQKEDLYIAEINLYERKED